MSALDRDRWNDPRTAPLVPVSMSIAAEGKLADEEIVPVGSRLPVALQQIPEGLTITIKVCGWDRERDEIIEFMVVADPPKESSVSRRPLTPDDREWLRRINART